MPTLGRFWMQPNIGSTDLIELFDRDNPVTMLTGVDVFSLYVQQILTDVATPQLGPNTYPALVAGDVFKQLKARSIPLAIEMGSIKPGDCQAKQAIAGMQTALQRVHDAGGTVAAFSMDEPLTANQASCHQSLDACADAVATFTHAVHALGPIAVGWLEAWPEVPVADMETFLHLLQARDALPEYWTLDIDWARAARERQDPVAFLTRCQVLATYYGVTLGIFCNATADPILTDAQHYANVTALAKREQVMVPAIARVCVAAWAHRRANDPTHATQNVPANIGPVGMLTTFAEVRATFEQQPIPAPMPEPEGDPMFATLIDPTKETLAVKAVKPTGDPGVCTLVLADYTTVDNGKPVLHVDDVFSCQPDGSAGTRPSGTAGAYERCTVSGNVATFRPADKYFARHFVKVVGL
jgi:hypothetical protein